MSPDLDMDVLPARRTVGRNRPLDIGLVEGLTRQNFQLGLGGHLFGAGAPRSDEAQQQQDNHNEQYQSQSAARVVTPARAVRPCWQRAEHEQQQNDNQKGSGRHDGNPGSELVR